MKKILLISLFGLTNIAQAQTETFQNPSTSAEQIAAPECVVPALTETYGTRTSPIYQIDVNSKSEIGKEYQEGNIIYYKEYKEAEKFYYPQADIKITNSSPLNKDYLFKKENRAISKFSFKSKAGKKYDIISMDEIIWFAVDEDGFICNGGYQSAQNWGLNNIFKYKVPQHPPLKFQIEQTKNQIQANVTKATAIQLVKADELQITLQTSQITNDKITSSRKFSLNAMKGHANLGDIEIKFRPSNGKNIILDELTEFTNSK